MHMLFHSYGDVMSVSALGLLKDLENALEVKWMEAQACLQTHALTSNVSDENGD